MSLLQVPLLDAALDVISELPLPGLSLLVHVPFVEWIDTQVVPTSAFGLLPLPPTPLAL